MENMKLINTRTLDELGRIIIPTEIRAKLGWGAGDTFDMYSKSSFTRHWRSRNAERFNGVGGDRQCRCETELLYYVDGNTIMLQLAEKCATPTRLLCGGASEVTETIKNKNICVSCFEEIRKD